MKVNNYCGAFSCRKQNNFSFMQLNRVFSPRHTFFHRRSQHAVRSKFVQYFISVQLSSRQILMKEDAPLHRNYEKFPDTEDCPSLPTTQPSLHGHYFKRLSATGSRNKKNHKNAKRNVFLKEILKEANFCSESDFPAKNQLNSKRCEIL